jgi:hypothetical protein
MKHVRIEKDNTPYDPINLSWVSRIKMPIVEMEIKQKGFYESNDQIRLEVYSDDDIN